ncbi:Flp pilus assembly protein CpaB [Citricoccus sp. GCM10030269]|uniref:Flp pilus assembly protein CpaB n=1 Tax=Citricoccus sp. GCM10030269 TaxID=3273388 RepID=UPI00361D73DB
MKKRIIGGIVAVLLAAIGTYVILAYVTGAERRALGEAEPTSVFVVSKQVPAGTPGEQLGEFVEVTEVPAKVVPEGSVRDLTEVTGQVAAVDLQPGEQVLAARFADPADLEEQRQVDVPEGMQEVTMALGSNRVVGGQVQPGDLVGIFFSFDPGTPESDSDPVSQLALHQVLVTQVQGVPAQSAPAEGAEQEGAAEGAGGTAPQAPPVPQDSVLVTVAVDTADAERIVYAQEFGLTWLSLQPEGTPSESSRPVTREEVYE